jgi:hypothetical protein
MSHVLLCTVWWYLGGGVNHSFVCLSELSSTFPDPSNRVMEFSTGRVAGNPTRTWYFCSYLYMYIWITANNM